MSYKKGMPDYFQKRSVRTERYFLRKSYDEQREIIRKPYTRPMAAQHLAALRIQRYVRPFLEYLGENPQLRKKQKIRGHGYADDSQSDQHFKPHQKLRAKFLTSAYNILHKSEESCFQNFCAAKIQATFKMALTRRLFKYYRFAMYHIAAIQIQWAWRGHISRSKKTHKKTREELACEKIQR
jgi:hypothetical protein